MILERLAEACVLLDTYIFGLYKDRVDYTPSRRFPMREVHDTIVKSGFPYLGRGHFKMAFVTPDLPYVLKIGAQKTIAYELSVYNRIPADILPHIMVPILWASKYCLLQDKVEVNDVLPRFEADRILPYAMQAKLTDLRYRNFGKCRDGHWRLFDYFGFDDVAIGLRGLTGILHRGHNLKPTRNPLDNLISRPLPPLSRHDIEQALSTRALGLDAKGYSHSADPSVKPLLVRRKDRRIRP